LRATLESFLKPFPKQPEQADKHALCRYPARYRYLSQRLSWKLPINLVERCPKYRIWTRAGHIKSISFLFATGYFGNPASYFGHPLLRLNTGAESEDNLLDLSPNYGAKTPSKENPIVYVFKGLFGGYPDEFSDLHYFYFNHNYSEIELRDMYEYRLNLEPQEKQYIIDHTWEVKGYEFPYFFLKDNCAYRMAELLETVYGVQLVPKNPLYTIPITVFESLGRMNRKDGRPLVSFVKKIPSRQSRMVNKYLALSRAEQVVVKKVIAEPSRLNSQMFSKYENPQKNKILATLMDFYALRTSMHPHDKNFQEGRRQVIVERLKLPIAKPQKDVDLNVRYPHQGQNSFMLRFGHLMSRDFNEAEEFVVRPALYDTLSPVVARPENTSLKVFSTRFRYKENNIELKQLDIFEIETLDRPKTDLPGEGQISWRARLGIFSLNEICDHCLVGGFEGGVGRGVSLFGDQTLYGLVSFRIQNNRFSYGTLMGSPEVGYFVKVGSLWKAWASLGYDRYFNGSKRERRWIKFENRFGNSRDWDVRLSYYEKTDRQLRLSLGLYY